MVKILYFLLHHSKVDSVAKVAKVDFRNSFKFNIKSEQLLKIQNQFQTEIEIKNVKNSKKHLSNSNHYFLKQYLDTQKHTI